MWDLPGPGIKPVSPALAGGFLTTVPPGKPGPTDFWQRYNSNSIEDDSLFDKRCWNNWIFIGKIRRRPTLYIKINSKQITDLTIKCKTIKLLEDNVREKLWELGLKKEFLDMTTKAVTIKEKKPNKLNFIITKNFCSDKRIKSKLQTGRK